MTRCDGRQTDGHAVSGAKIDGKTLYNLFSEVRAAEHAKIKKPVAKYFTHAGIGPLEPHIDGSLTLLSKALATRFAEGEDANKPFNFGEWLMYCMYSL